MRAIVMQLGLSQVKRIGNPLHLVYLSAIVE
jgi:hypothetical protein